MSGVALRARKLLDELEAWFLSTPITPPAYVQRQIDQLRALLDEVPHEK